MKSIKITNVSNPGSRPMNACYCDTFMCRFRGLMFRKSISPEFGLLLVEETETRVNAAIHMLFMRFDIGVVWINDTYEVVDKAIAKRWGLLYVPQVPARYTLEIHPERLADFRIGEKLNLETT